MYEVIQFLSSFTYLLDLLEQKNCNVFLLEKLSSSTLLHQADEFIRRCNDCLLSDPYLKFIYLLSLLVSMRVN